MSRTSTIRLSWRWSLLMLAVATTLATLAPMSAFANHDTAPNVQCYDIHIEYTEASGLADFTMTHWCPGQGNDQEINGVVLHLSCSEDLSAADPRIESYSLTRYRKNENPKTCGEDPITWTQPTHNVACGSDDTLTIPAATDDVRYEDAADDSDVSGDTITTLGSITINAVSVADGAVLDSWTYNLAAAIACSSDVDVAAGVQFLDPTCTRSAGYTTTTVTGVSYALTSGTVGPGNTVVVTATAASGYNLTNGPTFQHTFAAAPTNCSTPDPDPDPVTLGASFEVVCDDVNEVVTYTVTTDDAEMTSAQLLIGDSATEISFVDGEATGQVAWPDVDSADFAVITGEGSDIAGSIARPADLDCSEVLGVIIEPEPEPAPAPDEPETQPAQLPVTGFDTGTMLALALALMLAGIAGLRFQARREQA